MKTKTSTLLVGLFLGMSLGLLGGGPGGVLWASEGAGAVVEETAGAVPDEARVTDPESPDEVVPPAGNSVELNGDSVEYDPKGGKFVASGNVVIRQNNAVLFCDQVEFYREKQEAYATGNVVLKSDQGTIWAEKGFYHFGKKLGEFTHARIIADPVYGEAKTISKVGDNYFVMSEGYITTSDYDNPEWFIRSRHIEVFPGDKAVARRSTMFVGGIPVMYMPKYTQDLRENRPHLKVIPGYEKDKGMYLLTTYRTYPTDRLGVHYHLDYFERKDLGWGIDVEYAPGKLGGGIVRTYYMKERTISSDRIWGERMLPTPERERYRLEWRHKWNVDPQTSAIVQYAKISDADFLKKYWDQEYWQDENPETYALVTRALPMGSLSILTKVRVNRFESSTVERLPEISYMLNNQEIGATGLYFKSSNVFSQLVKKNASPSDVSNRTSRFDTDNEISRPFKVSFLEMRPYVGTAQTYYSRTLNAEDENTVRGLFKTGMDVSTKFYRVFDVSFDKWGIEIDRLRHVITPTAGYSYQHAPTFEASKLYPFDAIDARARSHGVDIGIENKIQTKRKGKVVDLFRSLVSTTYNLSDMESGAWSDITFDNEFHPNEFVAFGLDGVYDEEHKRIKTFNIDLYLAGKNRWSFDISRRYTRDDDDIVTAHVAYVINSKWRADVYERWNVDSGEWKDQQYALVRDLHSWEVELAFRDKRGYDDAGNEVWIIFRLKAFPSFKMDGGSSFHQRKAGAQDSN